MLGKRLFMPMGKTCSKPLLSISLHTKHSFHSLNSPNTPQNYLIDLCSNGYIKQAFTTYLSLISSHPRLISYLLKECINLGSLFSTQQLHSIAIVTGRSQIKFISNHLMNAYAKLGKLEIANKVFDVMPERNIMSFNILIGSYIQNGEMGAAFALFNEMGQRNSASWNAVITGLIKFEIDAEGLRLFTTMHVSGFLPDVYTLGSVLRGCAGLKDLIKGEQVHGYVIRSGLACEPVIGCSLAHMYMRCGCLNEGEKVIQGMPVRNIVAFNTLIAGKVQHGCALDAMQNYGVMKIAGLKPDKITFVSLISSCSDLATLGQGQQIHADVVKGGATLDVSVLSTLVGMYSRCGCLNDAIKVFEERDRANEDHVLWSSIISAYGFHGKGQEAIEVFDRMEREGIEANDVTFLSLLYSCSHCGLIDKGLEIFNSMVNIYKLDPHLKHYTCIVDLYGRSGRLEEAECFIRSMPVKPDAIIWKTLLSACKIHKNVDIAIRIAKEIIKIDPLNSASFVLLSNTNASFKRWEDASDIRKMMRESKVKKEPGLSWFEYKNKIHHFTMGDKSHPHFEDIDLYLKELMDELKTHGYVPDISSVMNDMDVEEKEHNLVHHSEKLAVAFALMKIPEGIPIRIMKNLRVCEDCHVVMKHVSAVKNREIIVRDTSRFHHFRNGCCSCRDYW